MGEDPECGGKEKGFCWVEVLHGYYGGKFSV